MLRMPCMASNFNLYIQNHGCGASTIVPAITCTNFAGAGAGAIQNSRSGLESESGHFCGAGVQTRTF